MKKKLIVTMMSLSLIFSMAFGAYAASNLTVIKAYLNNGIKFKLEGKAWTPSVKPITYKDTTYLPARAVAEATGLKVGWQSATKTVTINQNSEKYDVILEFPADRYPVTAAHISSAILAGESAVCTIDRAGADANRAASLENIPTKSGYDRDEWPMAMCDEGGAGASVTYIDASDNRGAGSYVGNALEQYSDGTKVKFVVSFRDMDADEKRTGSSSNGGTSGSTGSTVVFNNCAEAKSAGVAPLYRGDPGYSSNLDRDGDGVACEN